jgi:hypothetical protein
MVWNGPPGPSHPPFVALGQRERWLISQAVCPPRGPVAAPNPPQSPQFYLSREGPGPARFRPIIPLLHSGRRQWRGQL